jgi:osmotically-inducible protein OsmY
VTETQAMPPNQEPPQYLVQRLRRAIAEDPRTAEMGVQVKVRGSVVFLTGEVVTRQRCEQLTRVVGEAVAGMVPPLTVHNDVHVVPARVPDSREELS